MPTLNFKGKQFLYAHHLTVPFRSLDIDAKKSAPKDGKPSLDDNLIIHGDNLHGLKALLPQYAGKVKCIYIDPPYNTGNEGWCYNDKVNSPLMKEWLKDCANPVDKEDLERHDKWLSMMWPRLQLLRELLSDDGVIFISIDENEFHRLQHIADEILFEENFIGYFIWKNKHGGGGDNPYLVKENEFIICFAKNLNSLPPLFSMPAPNYEKMFRFKDNRGKHYLDRLDKKGIDSNRPNLDYPIECPDGLIKSISPAIWRLSEAEFLRRKELDEVEFKKDKNDEWQIYTKTYFLNEDGQPRRVKARSILKQEIVGFTQNGNKEMEVIFGERIFPNPKPVALIHYLLDYICKEDNHAIILDSFAGSGTTAHAVLTLNKEDGGNRKFILIECEAYADNITAERVRRVIKGVPNAKDNTLKQGLGGSFTFCKLGREINIENLLKGDKLPTYEEMARYVFYTATGMTLDKVKNGTDYLIGERDNYRVHLVYKPEVDFLRSGESALNMPLAKSIAENREDTAKTSLVFATHKFMGQKDLTDMGITYCQLPYAIHRVMGD